jgi:hypothetical protein
VGDRPGRHRGLVATGRTATQPAAHRPPLAADRAAEATDEPVTPPNALQVAQAGVVVGEPSGQPLEATRVVDPRLRCVRWHDTTLRAPRWTEVDSPLHKCASDAFASGFHASRRRHVGRRAASRACAFARVTSVSQVDRQTTGMDEQQSPASAPDLRLRSVRSERPVAGGGSNGHERLLVRTAAHPDADGSLGAYV